MILAGVVLSFLEFNENIKEADYNVIKNFSEIGIFILIFFAGLETDVFSLKKLNKNSVLIAIGGVLMPLFFGYFTAFYFTRNFNVSLIVGLILCSTSASVSIMTLFKLGRLKTVEGNTITNAALIDDTIGILILSIIAGVISIRDFNFSEAVFVTGFNIAIFAVIFIFAALIIPALQNYFSFFKIEHFCFLLGIVFIFVFLFFEKKINSFTIIGSYFAGVFLSKSEFKSEIEDTVSILQTIFVSVFFIFVGMQLNLKNLDINSFFYIFALLIAAFAGKVFGSGIFAKIVGFDIKRSLRIGVGMAPRGEIALICASLSFYYNDSFIITDKEFIGIIIIVLATIFATKYLLKLFFIEKKELRG